MKEVEGNKGWLYRLWTLAEQKDWDDARPRWFWSRLLRILDWWHGYTSEVYNDYQENDDSVQQNPSKGP